jgi:hypothetical protein
LRVVVADQTPPCAWRRKWRWMYLQHPHATTSRLSGSEQQPPEVRGTCAQSTRLARGAGYVCTEYRLAVKQDAAIRYRGLDITYLALKEARSHGGPRG